MTNKELKKVYDQVLNAYYDLADTRNEGEEETIKLKEASEKAYELKCMLDEIIHERIVSGKVNGFYEL